MVVHSSSEAVKPQSSDHRSTQWSRSAITQTRRSETQRNRPKDQSLRGLDLKIKRGADEFRLIRRWFAEEKRFCIWITNLAATTWSADEIMMIYRCRWQVELLFKELKSETNWRRFATGQKAIMEGLVWTSLPALIIRRYIAMQSMSSVSLYKAGKNVDTEPQ